MRTPNMPQRAMAMIAPVDANQILKSLMWAASSKSRWCCSGSPSSLSWSLWSWWSWPLWSWLWPSSSLWPWSACGSGLTAIIWTGKVWEIKSARIHSPWQPSQTCWSPPHGGRSHAHAPHQWQGRPRRAGRRVWTSASCLVCVCMLYIWYTEHFWKGKNI